MEDGQKKLQIFQLGLWMTILFDTMKGVMAIIKNDAYYNLTTLGDVNWNAPRPNAVATKKHLSLQDCHHAGSLIILPFSSNHPQRFGWFRPSRDQFCWGWRISNGQHIGWADVFMFDADRGPGYVFEPWRGGSIHWAVEGCRTCPRCLKYF